MNLKLVASIPVKPHLLKFVEYVENLQPGEFLDLKRNTHVTLALKILVTNKTNAKLGNHLSIEKLNKTYSANLRFKVNYRRQVFNEFFFTRKSVALFNQLLHTYFHDFLLEKILTGIEEGKTEKQVMYEVKQKLGLEDILEFDAMKKANYRLRIAKKIPTIHQQTRPHRSKFGSSKALAV